jgi:hypothetical protein
MDKISKTYKQYFGIVEQTKPTTSGTISVKDPKKAEDLAKKGINVHLTETELDEAELLNHISDYKGGVEYVVLDPTIAQQVQEEIEQFARKKGIKVINKSISRTGKVGYFLFRLGEFPAKESQKIQGYISQMPQIKHFRFNVKNQETDIVPVKKETGRKEL